MSPRRSEQNCLQASSAVNAACQCQQLAQGGAHGGFHKCRGARHARRTKHPRPVEPSGQRLRMRAALFDDDGNVDDSFNVGSNKSLAKETRLRGERRLVVWLAAMPFNGIEERRLCAKM